MGGLLCVVDFFIYISHAVKNDFFLNSSYLNAFGIYIVNILSLFVCFTRADW